MPADISSHHALADTLKETLKPLIRELVAEALAEREANLPKVGDDQRVYFQEEAAQRLGITWNQLRDERKKGRITASGGGGKPRKRPLYTQADLDRYRGATRGPQSEDESREEAE
jgi:hypothetical protein